MSKKNRAVKNLIEAHSWLGMIISIPLFIVFWAGSILLFLPEIYSWAETPSHPVDRSAPDMPLQTIVTGLLDDYALNSEEHLTIRVANEQRPYHQIYIDLKSEPGDDGPEQVAELKVDPKSGEVVGEMNQFHLVDFLYVLHYNLHLPGGTYLVGLVTLVFLVLILSGVWIHARKLFRNFFLYRRDRTRSRLLDIHNVVGVMSLPYTLMFAITGLIFNVSIILQIVFAVFLYQGDVGTLLEDAGYPAISQELSGTPMSMEAGWLYLEQLEQDSGHPYDTIRFYNYGDENAVLEVSGRNGEKFSRITQHYIALKDGDFIARDVREVNVVRQGLDAVVALHFGNFAGLDLRILYFLLGMGVAGMIIAGSLLWIDKRSYQQNISSRMIAFLSNLTLGGCYGTVVGTAVIFLAERAMPLSLLERGEWIGRIFTVVLFLTVIPAFLDRDKRRLSRICLHITAGTLFLTVVTDWILYGAEIPNLFRQGYQAVIGVEAGMLLCAGLCLWIARCLGFGLPRAQKMTPLKTVP